jgi:hypothetical protein
MFIQVLSVLLSQECDVMEEPSVEASRPTRMLVQLSIRVASLRDGKRGDEEKNTMRKAAGRARKPVFLPLVMSGSFIRSSNPNLAAIIGILAVVCKHGNNSGTTAVFHVDYREELRCGPERPAYGEDVETPGQPVSSRVWEGH